ncbi:MAG: capsid protein [Genomoviridae sp.]|nr:MAG: capsid protein [Genomoviridae sp.]
MAYAKRRSYSSRARRPIKRTARRTPRRSYVKRRSTTRRRPMGKKQVLNLTSVKKRDNMLSYSQAGVTPTKGPLILTGNTVYPGLGAFICPWVATARDMDSASGIPNTTLMASNRTSSDCFMVGLKETIRIETKSSLPWYWRRICFTFKGQDLSDPNLLFIETSSDGWSRLTRSLTHASSTSDERSQAFRIMRAVFSGSWDRDYKSFITAKSNSRLVSVKYDKTVVINSGNDSGVSRIHRRWHPMRKNLVYADRESGDTVALANMSTEGKPGMGDYYVLDIFQPHDDAGPDDQLLFDPEATLYWHER